jgi:D-alanine-D-alanine ligase
MNLVGICRIDYIIMEDIPYIIEINTIPGLSEESIIPKQLKAVDLKLSEVFEMCLLNPN